MILNPHYYFYLQSLFGDVKIFQLSDNLADSPDVHNLNEYWLNLLIEIGSYFN